MTKKPEASGRGATWLLRILVGGFITLVVTFTTVVLVSHFRGRADTVADLELRCTVTEIRQPNGRRSPNWYIASLSNAKSIGLESGMAGKLQVGDSIRKEKGEAFYTIRSKKTGQISRVRIN